ncbi:MAG: amidinotransferase [Armatimonadetes bacterium]|nr:amidinotransferase [Armatimonadota bacterium]
MKALTRIPSPRFEEGLTTQDLGRSERGMALEQHRGYREALRRAGVDMVTLEPDEHPDSCFVEDQALLFDGSVVLTRVGHPGRRLEQPAIEGALRELLPAATFHRIEEPGCLDGGDVCRVGSQWFVGLTARTNEEGYRQLCRLLEAAGQRCVAVAVPPAILHLKSWVSALGKETVLAVEEVAPFFREAGLSVVPVQPGDSYAANVLRLGRYVVMPAGFPRVARQLAGLELEPLQIEMSEFRKQDGSATCLSILW